MLPVQPRALRALIAPLLGIAVLLGACGTEAEGGETEGEAGSSLNVVATTPLIAEFASRVAGEDANVEALIPLGVDLHAWQPPTSIARAIAEADLLIVNGYNLEEGLLDVVRENARDGVPIVVAARGLEPIEGGHEYEHPEDEHSDGPAADDADLVTAEGDPHFWLSAHNAAHYVENIRDALVQVDAPRTQGYRDRAAALIEELDALDAEMRATLAEIPEERRTIVAFHDAYQYLAHEYGLEVVASVAPANPNQETSARAIADIVELVRDLDVTAVYREPEFDAQSLELIAQESGAEVLVLYSVTTEEVPTYAEMMRANATALVEGLASNGSEG